VDHPPTSDLFKARHPTAPAENSSLKIRTECYARHRGEEEPRAFFVDHRRVVITEILDRWLSPDHRYFKVRGDDICVYILRHDEATDQWEMTVIKRVAKNELKSEKWLRSVARHSGRSYNQMRVTILEFLDTDVFHLSAENCVSFLDPLIDSWDIDLSTFGMEIVLNRKLAPGQSKRFAFVETDPEQPSAGEPGLNAFLKDASLSGYCDTGGNRISETVEAKGRRPTPLYYYRELQNLRDPLHFRNVVGRTVGSEV
jgi:hypothetical protein